MKGSDVHNDIEVRRRILSRITIEDHGYTSPCWVSNRSRCRGGYTIFTNAGGRRTQTHRAAYAAFVGPIPNGMYILHACDNPPCCNPAHLRPGTPKDNTADAMDRKRLWVSRVTHCRHGHEYTPSNTYSAPDGKRRCIACRRGRATAQTARDKLRAQAGR